MPAMHSRCGARHPQPHGPHLDHRLCRQPPLPQKSKLGPRRRRLVAADGRQRAAGAAAGIVARRRLDDGHGRAGAGRRPRPLRVGVERRERRLRRARRPGSVGAGGDGALAAGRAPRGAAAVHCLECQLPHERPSLPPPPPSPAPPPPAPRGPHTSATRALTWSARASSPLDRVGPTTTTKPWRTGEGACTIVSGAWRGTRLPQHAWRWRGAARTQLDP